MSEPSQSGDPHDDAAGTYVEAVRLGVPLREPDGTFSYPRGRSLPQPNFTLDPLHRSLLWISVLVPVLLVGYVGSQMSSMPDEVPVHFGLDGSVNRYGSPWEGFWTMVGVTVVISSLAVLARFPRLFNYPVMLTSNNVQAQYQNAVQLMVWMNVSMAVITVGMMSIWFDLGWINLVWVGLGLMLVMMVFFIRRTFKLR